MASVLPPAEAADTPVASLSAWLARTYPAIDAHIFDADVAAWAAARAAVGTLAPGAGSLDERVYYFCQVSAAAPYVRDAVPFAWRIGGRVCACAHVDFERVGAAYAIATHLVALAAAEPLGERESTRRAVAHLQDAAGVLAHAAGLAPADGPADLAPDALRALSELVLAQAQERIWHRAVRDGLRDATVARLAAACAQRYASAQRGMPSALLTHCRANELHFAAAAQLRRSREDLAARRFADELARLALARTHTEAALRLPARALAPGAPGALAALHGVIDANLRRAERDNELVYLEAPTAPTSLAPIDAAHMAHAAPTELAAPHALLRTRGATPWLDRLATYGIDVALRVYSDRRAQYIDGEIGARAAALDAAADAALSRLHLPLLVDIIAAPRRVPASVRAHADAVAAGGGGAGLERRMAALRAAAAAAAARLARHPDADLAAALRTAQASDAAVAAKLADAHPLWPAMARGAAGLDDTLAPHVAALEAGARSAAPTLRALRAAVEAVGDERGARHAVLQRLRADADADDIRGALFGAAERVRAAQTRVSAADLEDTLQLELRKYRRGAAELAASAQRQDAHLARAEELRAALLRDAQIARGLAARKDAFRAVADAHAHYADIAANISEGIAFYTQLSARIGAQ